MVLMTAKHVRHLPVFEDSRFLGVISIGDVVKAIISEKQSLIDQLHDYISGKFGSHVRHGNPGRVRSALRPPTRHRLPARFARPRHTLPRWCAAGEGAREARGVGRVGCPSRRAGGLPTRNYFPALPRTSP